MIKVFEGVGECMVGAKCRSIGESVARLGSLGGMAGCFDDGVGACGMLEGQSPLSVWTLFFLYT